MALRREVRDLHQQVGFLEELAKSPLTTEEAAARFSAEAAEKRTLGEAKQARIAGLECSRQMPLF